MKRAVAIVAAVLLAVGPANLAGAWGRSRNCCCPPRYVPCMPVTARDSVLCLGACEARTIKDSVPPTAPTTESVEPLRGREQPAILSDPRPEASAPTGESEMSQPAIEESAAAPVDDAPMPPMEAEPAAPADDEPSPPVEELFNDATTQPVPEPSTYDPPPVEEPADRYPPTTPATYPPAEDPPPAAADPAPAEPEEPAGGTPDAADLFDTTSIMRVLGEPGGLASAETRRWHDASGRHGCQARLVGVTLRMAVLERADGEMMRVAFRALSDADLRFVHSQIEARRAQLSAESDTFVATLRR